MKKFITAIAMVLSTTLPSFAQNETEELYKLMVPTIRECSEVAIFSNEIYDARDMKIPVEDIISEFGDTSNMGPKKEFYANIVMIVYTMPKSITMEEIYVMTYTLCVLDTQRNG